MCVHRYSILRSLWSVFVCMCVRACVHVCVYWKFIHAVKIKGAENVYNVQQQHWSSMYQDLCTSTPMETYYTKT